MLLINQIAAHQHRILPVLATQLQSTRNQRNRHTYARHTVDDWLPDYLNLWTIKEGHSAPKCKLGDPIMCGATVRLEHTLTRKNLQSDSRYRAILSDRQDVSTEGYNGDGSDNDDWVIECNSGDVVNTNMGIHLRHSKSGVYLSADAKDYVFNEENCSGNCRIRGDREVHGGSKRNGGFQIKGV